MVKQAIFAQTGAAGGTIEFVAVANVVAALTALYGSIDELKHPNVSLSGFALEVDAIPTDAT